ncbi:MAG: thioredoxin family protein, partial [Staphylococcus epidermidis]|nr:thioredoxin family protein [Staphylococcus epidermidis]
MLNADLKQQLQQLLELMEGDVEFVASLGSDDKSNELKELLNEIAEMSAHITIGPFHFETFVSLTCQKCPDVVQALNLMSVINPNITHTMIDGAVFREESENIMAVPAVFLDGQEFGNGRMTVQDILTKLGSTQDASEFNDKDPYDVLIVGGGPASGSAAIYTARKGLRTGIVADRIGGQVNDTAGIENFITVKETTGSEFSSNLAEHIAQYDIDTMTGIRATNIEKTDSAIR